MATLDAPKVLLLINKTKLTLTVALTLTDRVTDIFTRTLSTPMKRLYRNNKRNFCGVCGWARFFRFLTFCLFADKNSIVT